MGIEERFPHVDVERERLTDRQRQRHIFFLIEMFCLYFLFVTKSDYSLQLVTSQFSSQSFKDR